MGAPFFAMAGVHWLALIMLYVGLALALLATVLYVRSGIGKRVRMLRREQVARRRHVTSVGPADSQAQLDPWGLPGILARASPSIPQGAGGATAWTRFRTSAR